VRSAGAHPRWSRPCAHCCALDSPAAWLRSSLRSTRGGARRRRAAPRRSCSCRRAHVTLHGTGCPRARAQRPGVLCALSLCMPGGSAAGCNAIVRLRMPRTACRFRRRRPRVALRPRPSWCRLRRGQLGSWPTRFRNWGRQTHLGVSSGRGIRRRTWPTPRGSQRSPCSEQDMRPNQ
jgi:hypothetical protein